MTLQTYGEKPVSEMQQTGVEVVPMNDLDQFVRTLVAWHAGQVKQLQHMLELPDDGGGTGVVIAIGEDQLLLEGPELKGFKAGIGAALALLGTLPFLVEMEDVPTAANDTGEANVAG